MRKTWDQYEEWRDETMGEVDNPTLDERLSRISTLEYPRYSADLIANGIVDPDAWRENVLQTFYRWSIWSQVGMDDYDPETGYLRPRDPGWYSMGKFQSELAERLYEMSLDDQDDYFSNEHDCSGVSFHRTDSDDMAELFAMFGESMPYGVIVEWMSSGAIYVSHLADEAEWNELHEGIAKDFAYDEDEDQ